MDTTGVTRRSVLIGSRDNDLDSVLALRRITAHLTELELVEVRRWDGAAAGASRPRAALVCDDVATAAEVQRSGVPVVFVRSGYATVDPVPVGAAAVCLHQPGWMAVRSGTARGAAGPEG
jgi:CGA synthase-related protein